MVSRRTYCLSFFHLYLLKNKSRINNYISSLQKEQRDGKSKKILFSHWWDIQSLVLVQNTVHHTIQLKFICKLQSRKEKSNNEEKLIKKNMQFEQLIRTIMKYRQANETRKRRGEKCRKETLPNDCLNILLTFVVMGDGDGGGGGPTLYLSYYFHFQFYHNYLQNSVIIVS